MTKKLGGNKELCEAIIPKNFGVGCRRPTVYLSMTVDSPKYLTLEIARKWFLGGFDPR
jgi:hypothetical protein